MTNPTQPTSSSPAALSVAEGLTDKEPLFGELVVAGTMRVDKEELTGLFIQMSFDDLRKAKGLPMYRRVSVTLAKPTATLPAKPTAEHNGKDAL